jgi:hypothetical protein
MTKDSLNIHSMPKELFETEFLDLDEIVRLGAHQIVKMAIETEIKMYLMDRQHLKLENGHQAFTRNGYKKERCIAVGAGVIPVRIPCSRGPKGTGDHFISSIVPPYMRRSLKIDEAIPLLYLRGLSNGDFIPCLQKLLGEGVRGLSPANITRLKSSWKKEYEA